MKSLFLALAAALALSAPVAAQPVGSPQNITVVDSGTACVTAPTACATFALDSATGSLSIGITGTWTGTLTFEGTNGNSIWTSVVAVNLATGAQATTTTASGLFSVTNAGVIAVRARATAAITGTAIVTAARGIGFTRLFGPSPTFTTVLLGDGAVATPSLAFASQSSTGIYWPALNYIGFTSGGGWQTTLGASVLTMRSDMALGWSAGTTYTSTQDLALARDAANTLAQRNGTNAQTGRTYNTYTDGSNNEYGEIGWSFTANRFSIMTKQNGSGTARILQLGTTGSAAISFLTANTAQFTLTTGGAFTGSNPTGGIGYAAGAGGAVTQLTSRTTGVTLNTVSGDITLFSAAGSATAASFTVTNSAVAATDNIIVNEKSGTNLYQTLVTTVGAGSFVVTFFTTGGTATDSPVFHFSVIKGASS